jgi:hypothetical protein
MDILGHSVIFELFAESSKQVTQQCAHGVQGDPGRHHQQAGHGQQHRDQGITHRQLLREGIALDDDQTQDDAQHQGGRARHAEVHQGAVLPHQAQDAVQDDAPLLDGGALGRVGVADGDRHLGHPQAVLMGQKLHLRFHAEVVRIKLAQLDRPGREGPKPALRIRHVDAGGHAGGQVDQLMPEPSAPGGVGGVINIARPDHNVGLVQQDGRQQARQLLGQVLAVGVDHRHRIGMMMARLLKSDIEGCALALVALAMVYRSARAAGDLGGLIGRAVVNHQDVHGVPLELEDHAADEAFFVVGRHDHQHAVLAQVRGGQGLLGLGLLLYCWVVCCHVTASLLAAVDLVRLNSLHAPP